MNVEHRFRGLLDIPLSETGRAEAWDAARSLVGSGVSTVYTSPLGRARQVAHAIAAATNLRTVNELPELVNLDYGRWEGLTREECADADPAAWALYAGDPELASCPDGESLASAADRILAALRTIADAHPGETVAAVSHGVMLRLAVLRVAEASDEDWQFALPTGAALTFEVDASGIALSSALDRSVPKEILAVPLVKTG
jgi:probable phosphoglycerate mutase